MVTTTLFLRRCVAAATAIAALSTTALPASAASSTNTLTVTASVINDCIIGAATLAFGTYDPTLSSPTTGSTTVSVTCTKGAGLSIALGAGANYVTASNIRAMSDGTSGDTTLQYSIYQPVSGAANAACGTTTAWGDGTSGTGNAAVLTITAAPSIASRSYSICGSIPAGQSVIAGTGYKDTVTETINF